MKQKERERKREEARLAVGGICLPRLALELATLSCARLQERTEQKFKT